MKPHKHNEHNTRCQVETLECRLNPSVSLDVLGLVTADVHLDLQANVSTPVGVNVDLALTL
jgi:hypothetical protein